MESNLQGTTIYLLSLGLSRARVAETFGKGVVVDLELSDLLVLICCDGIEKGLVEDVRPER